MLQRLTMFDDGASAWFHHCWISPKSLKALLTLKVLAVLSMLPTLKVLALLAWLVSEMPESVAFRTCCASGHMCMKAFIRTGAPFAR